MEFMLLRGKLICLRGSHSSLFGSWWAVYCSLIVKRSYLREGSPRGQLEQLELCVSGSLEHSYKSGNSIPFPSSGGWGNGFTLAFVWYVMWYRHAGNALFEPVYTCNNAIGFLAFTNTVYFNLAPSKSAVLKSTAHCAANTAVAIQIPGPYNSYKLIPM